MSRNPNGPASQPANPGENPGVPQTKPHDLVQPNPEPPAPVREPNTPQPAGDQPSGEPMRM